MKNLTVFAAAAVSALSIAGCVEVADAIEDPGAFECRERAASLMRVEYQFTSAVPINFDAFGNRNYNVTAAGQTFRCTVNQNDQITVFQRA